MPRKKIANTKDIKTENKKQSPKNNPPEEEKSFMELFPVDQKILLSIKRKVKSFSASYGFLDLDLPIIDNASLFDSILDEEEKKLLITFPARTKAEETCLRPELNSQVIKFFIDNKLKNAYNSARLFYFGPTYKKLGVRKNEAVQNYQCGFEVIGNDDASLEAEMIKIAHDFFTGLGLEITLKINNIGCKECLNEYWKQLETYYKNRKRYVCDECKDYYSSKSLEFFNCQKVNCQELAEDAPQFVDHLCEDCRENFVKILEYLDESEVPYLLDSKMVKNNKFFNKTIFSIEVEDGTKKKDIVPLVTGGRHDNFLHSFGEKQLTAAGFNVNVNELIVILKRNNFNIEHKRKVDVFLAQLGDEAKKKALNLFEQLRKEGIQVAHSFWENGLNKQIVLANKQKARFIIIIGQREIIDKTILLRDVETGAQEVVDYDKTISEINKRLNKGGVSNHFIDRNILQNSREKDEISKEALDIENLKVL